MSDDPKVPVKKIKPPIDNVTFVGYKGGELVWNTVEVKASLETDSILLNNKTWPGLRKVQCTYERIQEAPFEVQDGALYAGIDLEAALKGLAAHYDKRIGKIEALRERVSDLQDADLDVTKEARAQ